MSALVIIGLCVDSFVLGVTVMSAVILEAVLNDKI